MKMMTILGWLSITGLSWAAEEKVEFILPQQVRSNAIPIETKTGSLQIDGHEVGFEVMRGAAACYRVTDQLFVVQARNDEGGAMFLWDSEEKKMKDKLFDSSIPMPWPVAPKRRIIQLDGKEPGYYGVNPSSKKFVKIGTLGSAMAGTPDLLGGNSHRLFFLKETAGSRSWTNSRGFGEATLEIVESGKEPVEIKFDFGDFAPVGSDSIRGNRLLLKKLVKEENSDTRTPPTYQVACWDFEKERMEMLGKLEGIWIKSSPTPPKGGWGRQGEPEPKSTPYLRIWWLPQDQEVKPIGYSPHDSIHWVNPATMEITKTEPKASR